MRGKMSRAIPAWLAPHSGTPLPYTLPHTSTETSGLGRIQGTVPLASLKHGYRAVGHGRKGDFDHQCLDRLTTKQRFAPSLTPEPLQPRAHHLIPSFFWICRCSRVEIRHRAREIHPSAPGLGYFTTPELFVPPRRIPSEKVRVAPTAPRPCIFCTRVQYI
jgi:hypothetical protein